MAPIIEANRAAVVELCRRHSVVRLELFGEGTLPTFDPEVSDLDFLVEFVSLTPGAHYDAYFGLWGDLEDLFGLAIDLVETHMMRNPMLLRRVNASRVLLYAV